MTSTLPAGLRMTEVQESRYDEWLDRVLRTFGYAPASDEPHLVDFFRTIHANGHILAVADDSGYIATAGAIDHSLVMPGGGTLGMAGICCVTVDSTVRRRGVQRAMMAELHQRAVERELPIAGLPSSEWPIYERYGYGPAVWFDSLTVDVRAAGWRDDAPAADVRPQCIANTEARDHGRKLYAQQAYRTPGEVSPHVGYWDRLTIDPTYCRLDELLNLAGHDAGIRECVAVPGQGMAAYRIRPGWTAESTPNSTLHVTDLLAAEPEVAAALWQHILSVDLVSEVRVSRSAVDDPLRWWVEDARHLRARRHDGLWLRPFDVPRLLEARQWSGMGALTLSVHDREGYASGTFRVEVDDGHGSCSRTTSRADLEMDVAALGAILLGGTSATGLARSGRIRASSLRHAQLWDSLASPERAPFFSYPF